MLTIREGQIVIATEKAEFCGCGQRLDGSWITVPAGTQGVLTDLQPIGGGQFSATVVWENYPTHDDPDFQNGFTVYPGCNWVEDWNEMIDCEGLEPYDVEFIEDWGDPKDKIKPILAKLYMPSFGTYENSFSNDLSKTIHKFCENHGVNDEQVRADLHAKVLNIYKREAAGIVKASVEEKVNELENVKAEINELIEGKMDQAIIP